MENKLEQLLNSLIEKGWKPRQHTDFVRCNYYPYSRISFETVNESGIGEYTLRELVSKESGLWQFVCKNGMIKNPNIERYWKDYFELDHIEYYQSDFQYWLLESSLKDESELEEFLLSNINIKG